MPNLRLKKKYRLPVFGAAGIALCFMLLQACAPNKIYRSTYTACYASPTTSCDNEAISIHNQGTDSAFQLGFVEYDDQGQLRDRKQMQTVLDHYYPIAGQDDVILTVFVHGWHHSAEPGDGNVESFKAMLEQISLRESQSSKQDGRTKRRVLGVYIGWRGDTITAPVLQHSTFWGRKAVAHEVGLQGVSEVLLRLEEIVNVKAAIEQEDPKPLNSRMVVIGHSFGGAVVYTSLQQILADRYIDSRKNKSFQGNAQGFGDLVVLMNPAFEAMRFGTLFDIGQSCLDEGAPCRNYAPDQLPRLAVLTSEADLATRYAFPMGRVWATTFKTHDTLHRLVSTSENAKAIEVSEYAADNKTIGHFEPYWTHTLKKLPEDNIRPAHFNYRTLGNRWSEQDFGDTLEFEEVALNHLDRSHPRNPYLNIYVDEELIDGHNDIWREEIQHFLQDLIIIATMPEQP